MCSPSPVEPRLIQKEEEPTPSREEETSSHQLSKHQQISSRAVSRKHLRLLSSGAWAQTLQTTIFLSFVTSQRLPSVGSDFTNEW